MNVQRHLLLCLLLLAPRAEAQDWPQWRGPHFDGSTTATGLPETFSTTENLAYVVELPGPGAGTPVIHGERVFVSSIDEAKDQLIALCIDRASGEVLWRDAAGSGYKPKGEGTGTHIGDRTTYASPSPITDGTHVVFFYGNGDLVAYDVAGKRLWAHNVQKEFGDFCFQWTFAATPTLWKGRVHLPVLQRDTPVRGRGKEGAESFLLAYDVTTGELLYRHVREVPGKVESRESYGTMIPRVRDDGSDELIVIGGDVITGHDPATGKERWRWGTWNQGHREIWWRVVPSACVGKDVVLVCAPKRAPIYAVALDGEGDLGEKGLVWQSDGRRNPLSSDVPTPAYANGRFYVLSDVRSALSRVDPASGSVDWTIELPSRSLWRASPTVAEGRVYLMNHAGEVLVVEAETGKPLHTTNLGEEDDDLIRSSIAIAHGQIFVRTNTKLYAFASKKSDG